MALLCGGFADELTFRDSGLGGERPSGPTRGQKDGGEAPQSTPAARPIDDQAIIVVTNSDTGEIRACGDLTGYCIGMNPWNKALVPSRTAPIGLTEHATAPSAGSVSAAATPDHPTANSARSQ